jgi:hypothetical protein
MDQKQFWNLENTIDNPAMPLDVRLFSYFLLLEELGERTLKKSDISQAERVSELKQTYCRAEELYCFIDSLESDTGPALFEKREDVMQKLSAEIDRLSEGGSI